MSRFDIEDILSQDKRGIVFRAHDSELGHTVALRRFFPFGQDGGGLKADEAVAFQMAAERLVGLNHPGLRSVFSGAVDPIDNMPYMVAEWIDGAKLDEVLNGQDLDPRLVIQILQLALETSITLSEIFGEEALWVETDTDSIFVGSRESDRGFVFWLSPFKWLGAEIGTRKVSALVELGERLAGWKGKLIGDHTGHGLGGWLKWMKSHPDASLAQALEALPAVTSNSDTIVVPAKPAIPAAVVFQPVVNANVKQPSSASPIVIAACVGLFLIVGVLVYLRMNSKAQVTPPQNTEQTIPPATTGQGKATLPESESTPVEIPPEVAPQPTPKNKPQPAPEGEPTPTPKPAPQPPDEVEAISASKVQEMAEKLAREKEAARAADLAPPVVIAPPVRDFTPGDADKMTALKASGHASVTGIVLNVRLSGAGNSLYFEFSNPTNDTEIAAVALKREYKDEFAINAYKDLKGKKVRFDGTVYREPTGKQYVKISSRSRMKIVE